jgi:hypothetical protein
MDAQFEELLKVVHERRGDVVQAECDKLPGADVLELRKRAHRAWEDAEEYRQRTGCSPNPVP